jgi:plasmid maintenance system antidote protein VapI
LNEYALNKASGVAPIVIDRFLNGERGLTFETAGKLAAVLGLHLAPFKAQRQRK